MSRICNIILAFLMLCPIAWAEETSKISLEQPNNILNFLEIDWSKHYLSGNDNDFLNRVTFGIRDIPGSVDLELVGIHKLLFSQAQRRLKGFARNQLRIYYGELDGDQRMSVLDFNNEMSELNDEFNPYGQWWERRWFHSLPPEQGGAPLEPQKIEIGLEIRLPEFVQFFQDKIAQLGDIWIDNSDLYKDLNNGPQSDSENTSLGLKDLGQYKLKKELNISVTHKEYEWFEGKYHHFRFKPTIKIQGDGTTLQDVFNEISVQMTVELFSRNHTSHFADINFLVKYDIIDNETAVMVNFAFLKW